MSEVVTAIRKHAPGFQPAIGLILGSGLDGLVDDMRVIASIDYKDLPHFVPVPLKDTPVVWYWVI